MLQLFSSIIPPTGYPSLPDDPNETPVFLINFVLKIVFIAAGLYSLWNFIQAGYIFIGSSGDAKELGKGRDKFIWTFVGLLVMISAVVVAGIIGFIVYGDWDAILNPKFDNSTNIWIPE